MQVLAYLWQQAVLGMSARMLSFEKALLDVTGTNNLNGQQEQIFRVPARMLASISRGFMRASALHVPPCQLTSAWLWQAHVQLLC